ncbi:MAG: hypothetical protein HYS09_05420 [Chloroflexi bacterium]|nr:hypothetical protein [Chloroflexota bacterium]
MATIRVERADGRTVDEIEWKAEELEIVERPNGAAAAAILSAGFGALVLGLLASLSEASTAAHDWFDFQARVGPLSGKTIMSVVAYVASWAVLAPVMWKRSFALNTVFVIAAVLIGAGLVGTFPKFFELFAPE